MGINFGAVTPSAPAPAPAAAVTGTAVEVSTPQGLTLDLSKGAVLDLSKSNPGLKNVKLAAGWDATNIGAPVDLDISAFLLNANGKISSTSDVIYFGNKTAPGVKLNGDNLTGDGDGDDEIIDLELDKIAGTCQGIVFAVNIYDGINRKQTFGMVENSYVRLLNKDEGDKELCRFVLKDDYSSSTAVIFAKLKRNANGWEFEAIGEGKVVKDLNDILATFS